MYTYGQPEKVWPNGLIQYGPGTRGDGAFMDQIAGWKVEKAEAELEALENEGKDTTEAEERVEAAMDELMKYQSLHLSDAEDDEEEEDSDAEVELGTKRKGLLQGSQSNTSKKSQKDSSDERMEPNSFSRIDVQTLRSNTPSQKFPLLAKATQTQVELAQGEALYLPTGWFHEVTSSCSDGKEGLHMAFNYWMCPPTTDDFENPYEDTYWEENWNEVTRLIDAMGSK